MTFRVVIEDQKWRNVVFTSFMNFCPCHMRVVDEVQRVFFVLVYSYLLISVKALPDWRFFEVVVLEKQSESLKSQGPTFPVEMVKMLDRLVFQFIIIFRISSTFRVWNHWTGRVWFEFRNLNIIKIPQPCRPIQTFIIFDFGISPWNPARAGFESKPSSEIAL